MSEQEKQELKEYIDNHPLNSAFQKLQKEHLGKVKMFRETIMQLLGYVGQVVRQVIVNQYYLEKLNKDSE